jgi:hypothetical protein
MIVVTSVPTRRRYVACASAARRVHASKSEKPSMLQVSGIQAWSKPSSSAHLHSCLIPPKGATAKVSIPRRRDITTEAITLSPARGWLRAPGERRHRHCPGQPGHGVRIPTGPLLAAGDLAAKWSKWTLGGKYHQSFSNTFEPQAPDIPPGQRLSANQLGEARDPLSLEWWGGKGGKIAAFSSCEASARPRHRSLDVMRLCISQPLRFQSWRWQLGR